MAVFPICATPAEPPKEGKVSRKDEFRREQVTSAGPSGERSAIGDPLPADVALRPSLKQAKQPRDLPPASPSLVSRVRNRLFPAKAAPVSDLVAEGQKRGIGFQASIAELLLINRLKALGRRDQSAEIMERASHIVFVTCQNWFTEPEAKAKSLPHKARL